jgi:hypothetical protein
VVLQTAQMATLGPALAIAGPVLIIGRWELRL